MSLFEKLGLFVRCWRKSVDADTRKTVMWKGPLKKMKKWMRMERRRQVGNGNVHCPCPFSTLQYVHAGWTIL